MKRFAPLLLALSLAATAWAEEGDGYASASEGMSKQLLCGVITVGSGNIALFAGLLLALYGLWAMVRHAALKSGLIFIVCGALLTALPSLILSGLGGLSTFLNQTGISNSNAIDYIQEATNAVGNCSSIAVDFSAYGNAPAWWQGFNNPEGVSNPTVNPSGRYKSSVGTMDPNAQQGTSGCTDLVEGGQPGSPFGPRQAVMTQTGRYSSSAHKGLDVRCGARRGAPTHAAAGGTVTEAYVSSSYGKRVVIDSGGKRTTYNHFDSFGPNVRAGGSVSANDVVGYCGATGNVTGPHLHFEVLQDGQFVDPQKNGCGR